MKKKPIVFNILSITTLLLGAFPIVATAPASIISFSYSDLVLISFATCGSFFAWRVSAFYLVTLPILIPFSLHQIFDPHVSGQIYVATFFLALHLFIFYSSVRELLLKPSLHWWQTPIRVFAQVPAVVASDEEDAYKCEIHDISEAGILINIEEIYTPSKLRRDQHLNIRFLLARGIVKCRVQVVRKLENENRIFSYRYGLRIVHIEDWALEYIRNHVKENLAS
jgi:hypothetical protein